MQFMKSARAVVISARPKFAAVVFWAQWYHPHIGSGIRHVMHLNRMRPAYQASEFCNLPHMRQPFNSGR